jgi:hypothetical protein
MNIMNDPRTGRLREAWLDWFGKMGPTVTAEVINATAQLVIAEREVYAEEWKRRAEQHGCNVEEGDHECG